MAAAQPGFLDQYRAGSEQARAAACSGGAGNASRTAVQSWERFTMIGLRVPMRRPLDPLTTSLDTKLSEVDLVGRRHGGLSHRSASTQRLPGPT